MLEAAQVILENMGVGRAQQRLFFRAMWVLAVTGHMAWVCGFLAGVGLASPFVRAEDIAPLKQQVATLERAATASARINLQQEIRAQTNLYCSLPDGNTRDYVMRRIDELRAELYEIAGVRIPDPICTRGSP